MEQNEKVQKVIDWFEIPDPLARGLSELLVKQTIRERILIQLVGEPEKYEEAEKLLIPITAKIEAIKTKITKEYIPAKYNSRKYMWNYNSYEIDENKVEVIEML
jgi:hypothetical protein